MTTLFRDVGALIYQPYWADTTNNAWLTAGGTPTVPAGVKFQTVIPHPFAAIGEEYIEVDLNNANHRIVLANPTAVGGSTSGSVRQAGQAVLICQFTAANPTSDAIIFDNDALGTVAGTADYRKLVWVANSKTLAFYAGATPTLISTSVLSVPATTDIQLEVIEVVKDSAGNTLPNRQIVVRYSTLVAGAQGAVTTLINALTSVSGAGGSQIYNICVGENAAKGGGKFYFGNARCIGIDADNPPGISRVDRLEPNANTGHITQWANDFTLVNESGTGVPSDDAGNGRDSINYASVNTNKTQVYDMTAQHTAVGDTILFLMHGTRGKYSGTLDKGATNQIAHVVSDGTTDIINNSGEITLSTSYQNDRFSYMDKPGGSGWAHSDLTAIQCGYKGLSSTTGSAITHFCTVETLLVAYQASGETMPAVPGAPPKIPSIFVRQGVNRAGTY